MIHQRPISDVLAQVVAGLTDSANQYIINANYYDREGEQPARWWLLMLWVHRDTVQHVELEPEHLVCEVLLNSQQLDDWTRIRVPLSEIWQVQHLRAEPGNGAIFDSRAETLFYEHGRMQMPPVK